MAGLFVNASNSVLSVSSAPLSSGACTISAWVKPASLGNFRNIVLIYKSTGSVFYSLASMASGDIRCYFENGAEDYQVNKGTLTTGTWFHVALRTNGSNAHDAFVNGSKGTTNTNSYTGSGFNRFAMGRNASPSGLVAFDGDIAEVAVYDASLADSQITSLAARLAPPLVAPSSLVFYNPMIRTLEADIVGSLTLSNTSVTASDHPRIIRSVGPKARRFTTAAAPGGNRRRRFLMTAGHL